MKKYLLWSVLYRRLLDLGSKKTLLIEITEGLMPVELLVLAFYRFRLAFIFSFSI